MTARGAAWAALLLATIGCRTMPPLPADAGGCYDVLAETPIPPFMGSPAPVLPSFVQIQVKDVQGILVPSTWVIERGPGNRSVSLSTLRPAFGVEGESMTQPRPVGLLPKDSLVLSITDLPGEVSVLLARDGTNWRGRAVRPGPPVMVRLASRACPNVPMTRFPGN